MPKTTIRTENGTLIGVSPATASAIREAEIMAKMPDDGDAICGDFGAAFAKGEEKRREREQLEQQSAQAPERNNLSRVSRLIHKLTR